MKSNKFYSLIEEKENYKQRVNSYLYNKDLMNKTLNIYNKLIKYIIMN